MFYVIIKCVRVDTPKCYCSIIILLISPCPPPPSRAELEVRRQREEEVRRKAEEEQRRKREQEEADKKLAVRHLTPCCCGTRPSVVTYIHV